ncbi:hypothetical protein M2322_003517 [Rhodoblastus acidophilus]|uniref:hypothetical protein n=1 Tax=Rhodoblastus acidophilus TaxID=1074 RepID=UPI0022250047|nr:hypothetical protein [Rhodoblastus acidophilus]MCW2317952.1 hypothetical protein [Rhodoblastus acidophilus]
MLIDDSGLIGGARDARVTADRSKTSLLIAKAIANRSADSAQGWTQIAETIAALAPDFVTLLRFMRREPALLRAYFAVEDRIAPLIAVCGPAERALARYARDLAANRAQPIVDLADDENLRVRLYELALIAGAADPPSLGDAADALGLRTPTGVAALAFLLLKTERASSLPQQIVGAWPRDRRRVFFWRYLALMFQRRLAPFNEPARHFGLVLDDKEKARVARLMMPGQFAAARRTGLQVLRQSVRRSPVTPLAWFSLSLTLPRLSRLISLESWTALARATLGTYAAGDFMARPRTVRLMTQRFGVDGVLHLYQHYGVRSLFEQSLENGARSTKKILKDFSARYPKILPPQVLETVGAFTVDRDTFVTLVNEYLTGRAAHADADIAEIMGAVLATPAPVMRSLLQCETGRRLMAALTQFKNKHDINLLRAVAFAEDAPAHPADMDGFLYELRNAFALELAIHAAQRDGRLVGKPTRRKLFESFFLREFQTDQLPVERLDSARQHLRARAVGRINAVLDLQAGAARLETEDLEALARDWRDPEPVVTLLARLSDPARRGGPSRDAAHLVLHAAKAAAQRKFMAFKFEDARAQRQLAFLSEAQRAIWRQPRALARVGEAQRPDNQARLDALTRGLRDGLTRLCDSEPAAPAPLTQELRAEMSELAREEIKANPIVVAERALAAHVPRDAFPACARACLLDIAAGLDDAVPGGFARRNAARMMRALARLGFPDAQNDDAFQEVIADLRAIEREIPKDMLDGEAISRGLVVTAFDCSPRLMLTIGDIVNTGCCLNYQSGGRINVLPAYLVDANIQALVSWRLKQSHFASLRDYKAVLGALLGRRPTGCAFDGDRLVFRFALPDGATVETQGLGFAHLRQIVRLGRVRYSLSLRPGLHAERAYAQPHPLQPLMHANHSEILRALASELQAVEGRALNFPASRNPDGVYCDALGGVQSGEYTVHP